MKWTSTKLQDLVTLIFLSSFSTLLSFLVFPHVPSFSLYEGSPLMHISEVRMVQENFPSLPLWNNNWYFGNPFLRFYPPLSQYLMALTGWTLKISPLQSFPIFTAIIFTFIGISAFYFCRTLRFSRSESVISALFLLTAFNLYSYWDAGSNPNIVAFMLSLPIFIFTAKAIETGKIKYTIGAGIFIATVALSHLQNLLIIVVLVPIFTFTVSYFREEIFGPNVSKRSAAPFFFESWLVGGTLSLWWFIPYIVEGGPMRAAPYLQFSTTRAQSFLLYLISKINEIIGLKLDASNYISPGILFFGIACLSFIFMFKKHPPTRAWLSITFFAFTLLILLGFFSLLKIPLGMSDRFSPYFSLFTAILVGYSLNWLYENISKFNQIAGTITLLSILGLAIAYNSYIILTTFNNNRVPELVKPQFVTELEKYVTPGERVIVDDISQLWKITAHSDIQQWGGSDAAAMTNEFDYWLWNKIIYKPDSRYLQYFSRSFNVRFYSHPLLEMTKIEGTNLWEINEFNSSLVETIDSTTNRILFIGRHTDYMDLFLSISKLNPEDCLLVYGGATLSYDADTIKNFQAIYLDSLYAVDQKFDVISTYLESGGGVIFDLGLNPTEAWDSLPTPMPVTTIKPFSLIELNKTILSNEISNNVNLSITNKTSQGVELTPRESNRLVTIDGKTFMASSDFSGGRILVSGLGLPRIAVNEDGQDISQFLLNTIKYVVKNSSQINLNFPSFTLGSSDVTVYVADAQEDDAIWLKISKYPGWTAMSNGKPLNIFEAGPGFMLVFPKIQGNGIVYFAFTRTNYVVLGIALSFLGIIYVIARLLIGTKLSAKLIRRKFI